MINQKVTFTLVLIVVLVFYIWWAEPCKFFCHGTRYQPIADPQYQRQIEMLQHKNNFLHQLNRQLDSSVVRLMRQTDSLKQLAQSDQHTIIQLKKNQNEKIKHINHFSNAELLEFFSNLDHATDRTTNP